MKLAVFSDVHGNLPALEMMIKDSDGVDGYICLGDVVNFGPWSNECVDLVSSLPNIVSIEGNHEKYFLEGKYGGHNPIAQAFFDHCYPPFSRYGSIDNLVNEYELGGFTFCHTLDDKYVYPDSVVVLDKNYVIGHSHHQFKTESPPFVLYNAGSVGQNRKYIDVINYIILDTANMDFKLKSLVYEAQLIIREMKRQEYPKICTDYYEGKQRSQTSG